MSKIFRLYKGETEDYWDWKIADSYPYNSYARDTIDDYCIESVKHEILSVPSPFVRIDLVNAAFREVNKRAKNNMNQLAGNTIFHKIVSNTLDVGEIFFNYNLRYDDKIEIITWDYAKEIESLLHSTIDGHRYYGAVLEKFMRSDSKRYNFDKLNNIYLLNYKNGPDKLNIVGATSPTTIFFPSPNDLSYFEDYRIGIYEELFRNKYTPLCYRNERYIRFWFLLKNTIEKFATLFPEINTYLELTYVKIDNNLKQVLRYVDKQTDDFDLIQIYDSLTSNFVEVLGNNLYQESGSGVAPSIMVCGRSNKYANQTSNYDIEGVFVTYYSAPKSSFEEEISRNRGSGNNTIAQFNQLKEWDSIESSLFRTHGIDMNQRFEKEIDDNRKEQEIVYSSIFAPAEVKRKSHMLVQIYLHLYEETEKVKALAQESEKNAERRDYIPLQCKLKKGDKVDVLMNICGEVLLMSEKKSVIWHGSFTKCSFDYFVPKDIDVDELSCVALLTVNEIPIGEMRFITKIVESPRQLNPEIIAHKYNKVFISYSHQDESKVKFLHEGLAMGGVPHFFDRSYLKPGDIFPKVIQDYINSADLFVLCWSENAAQSDYVKKERIQALERAYPKVQDGKLLIYPISIEPRTELPSDMKENYHFGEI